MRTAVTNRQITFPFWHASWRVDVVALAIGISDVGYPTEEKDYWLLEVPCSILICQQSRTLGTDAHDTRVLDLIVCFDTAAGPSGCYDTTGVDVGICAFAGLLDNPVNALLHHGGCGLAGALQCAACNDEHAIRGELLEEGCLASRIG